MITYWTSLDKLNIFLYITGQCEDGYHILQALFQFLNYGSSIIIESRWDGQLNLLTPIDNIEYEDNIVIKSVRLLIKEATKVYHLIPGSGLVFILKSVFQ